MYLFEYVPFSYIYSIIVPALFYVMLLCLRLLFGLISPASADSVVLLLGLDVSIASKQLDISNLLRSTYYKSVLLETFIALIVIGFALMIASVWLEKTYYEIEKSESNITNQYAASIGKIFFFMVSYIPSGAFIAMHIWIFSQE